MKFNKLPAIYRESNHISKNVSLCLEGNSGFSEARAQTQRGAANKFDGDFTTYGTLGTCSGFCNRHQINHIY